MITRKSSTTQKKNKDKLSFHLGLSGFLSLAILVVIGMAWSFILGVIVGRGYQPEKMAMEMAQKVLPEDIPLLTEKNEEVLKGEELEFFEKLKQGPSSVPPAPVPQAKAVPPQPKPKEAETPKTTDAAAVSPAQSPIEAALQSAAATAGQSAPAEAKENKGEVFVFNYQVAALASMEQAQTFLKKLDPGKFKTSVVTATHEGKTWYRVYVHHQGTVDSALALKEQLKGNGISGILLRSRTPL